jgi:putative colanic acid biosynthesis acetyltransferase WcaF
MTSQSKVNLKSHDHAAFHRGSGKAREVAWYLLKMLFFLTSFPIPSRFKVFLLRLSGAKLGKGTVIRPRVNIQMPWKLVIGDYCWIGEEVFLLNFDQLIIGNNVCISQRAFLCGGNHDYKDPGMAFRPSAVTIGDGVWIGAAALIGPGVKVGTDCVIAAGAVVCGDLDPNGVYKGNPALKVSERWAFV